MALFRKAQPQEPLIVSISGVRMGQRILGVIGADARLFLDAASKVGITGRAQALVPDAATIARVEAAAVKHGVLLEATALELPLAFEDGSFDLAIVDDRKPRGGRHDTTMVLPHLGRVLRPGARVVVAVAAPTSALAGLFGFRPPDPDVTPLLATLTASGFTAARFLAARDGVGFVEAARHG